MLIRRMSRENPTWGVPRILLELQLLGYDVEPPEDSEVISPPQVDGLHHQYARRAA